MPCAPRFTIVTVCFNAEATVAATAQSLATQCFTDYEWLVVDGASKDNTLRVVEGLAVPNKRVVSEPDDGIYDAMNKATKLARGEWLYFLNCGDAYVDANVLADLSRVIDADTGVQLIWGDMLYFDAHRQWARRFRHITPSTLPFDDLNHQAVFARRTLFNQHGRFNLGFRTSADYDWLIRVLSSGTRYRYLSRTIARFAVGGAHSADPDALKAERQRLRLQYVAATPLRRGLFMARIRRRLRILWGHGG